VKNFLNRLSFDRIMIMSLWPRFFGPPCRSTLLRLCLCTCSVQRRVVRAYNDDLSSAARPVAMTTWSLCLILNVTNDVDHRKNRTVPQSSALECGLPDLSAG